MKSMTDDKPFKLSRRKLLGTATAVGVANALPSHWSKPVVDVILLPSHAMTTPPPPPPPPPSSTPVVANLSGVTAGAIGTSFTVDASASTGGIGASLVFIFIADTACTVESQSGALAVIRRNLVTGPCNITVEVTDGNTTDSATATAIVTGGPPAPP